MKYLVLFIFLAFAGLPQAQPISSATTDELIEKLRPATSTTRSIGRNLAPQTKSIDLVIQFEFNSTRLKPESKPLIDNLVSALKSEQLKNISFLVEGHTDAQGSYDYNQSLSLKRANSVVQYMTQQGIIQERLKAEGKGFSDLLLPEKPLAMENRRVRITAVSQ